MGNCMNIEPTQLEREITIPAYQFNPFVTGPLVMNPNTQCQACQPSNILPQESQGGIYELKPLSSTYASDQQYASNYLGAETQSSLPLNNLYSAPPVQPIAQNIQPINGNLGLGQTDYLNSVNQEIPLQQNICENSLRTSLPISGYEDPNTNIGDAQVGQSYVLPGDFDLSKLNLGAPIVYNGPEGPQVISNTQNIQNPVQIPKINNLQYTNNLFNSGLVTNLSSGNLLNYNNMNLNCGNINLNRNNLNQLAQSQIQFPSTGYGF